MLAVAQQDNKLPNMLRDVLLTNKTATTKKAKEEELDKLKQTYKDYVIIQNAIDLTKLRQNQFLWYSEQYNQWFLKQPDEYRLANKKKQLTQTIALEQISKYLDQQSGISQLDDEEAETGAIEQIIKQFNGDQIFQSDFSTQLSSKSGQQDSEQIKSQDVLKQIQEQQIEEYQDQVLKLQNDLNYSKQAIQYKDVQIEDYQEQVAKLVAKAMKTGNISDLKSDKVSKVSHSDQSQNDFGSAQDNQEDMKSTVSDQIKQLTGKKTSVINKSILSSSQMDPLKKEIDKIYTQDYVIKSLLKQSVSRQNKQALIKLLFKRGQIDMSKIDNETKNRLDTEYDNVLQDIQNDIDNPKEKEPKDPKRITYSSKYFDMKPFRIVNTAPFKMRELVFE